MKKRALSLLLALAILFSFAVPAMAADLKPFTGTANIQVDSDKISLDGGKGLTVKWFIHADAFTGTSQVMLTYDTSKLTPYTTQNKALTVPATWGGLSRFTKITSTDDFLLTASAYGMTHADGKSATLMAVITTDGNGSSPCEDCTSGLSNVATFNFKLADGVDYSDLSQKDFHIATAAEIEPTGQSSAINIMVGGTNIIYGNYNSTAEYTFATAPVLKIAGEELPAGPAPALTGIDVTLSKATVNLNGSTDSLTASAAPQPSDANLGTVAWSVAPTGKGVTINANTGAVAVARTADAGTYTVTATSGSITGTKTFTVNKAAAAATTVTLNPASFSANAKVPQPGQTATYALRATVTDQYGQTFTDTIDWDLPDGITHNGTQLVVSDAVTVGSKTITAKAHSDNTKTASITLSVVKGDGPAAPTGITAEDATVKGGNGKLKGVNDTMEYKASNASTWTAVPSGATEVSVPAGSYTVRVKETTKYAAGAATSAITISQPGTSAQPAVRITGGGQIAEGGSATLTATLTNASACTGTLTYKWYKDNVELSGKTGNSITVTEAGTYKVEVTHTNGANDPAMGSAEATVTVKQRTAITLAGKTGEVALTENEDGKLTWKLSDVVNANTAIDFDVVATDDPAVFENEDMGITVTFYEGDEKAEEIVTGTEYKVVIEVAADVPVGNDYTLKATTDPVESTITFVLAKKGYDQPYINGIMDTDGIVKFMPEEQITRGQVATIMARLSEGFDAEATYTCDLPDYNGDGWSGNYVAFCANNGIVSGSDQDGTLMFLPGNKITRAEFAKMLALTAGVEIDENDTEYKFDDTLDASTSWAVTYINALQKAGIVEGSDDDGDGKFSFKPADPIKRSEVVAMVNRAFGLADAQSGEEFDVTFPDITESGENAHWAWKYVMPAANVPVCDFLK